MIRPHVFSKSCRADTLPTVPIAKVYKPYLFLEFATLSVIKTFVLFLTTSVGIASIVLLGFSSTTAVAQIPSASKQMLLGEKTMSQVNVLFVNPSAGDDRVNNGSEGAPLKTITQALRIAQPNTVIMLSPSTYSTETGEVFPLILKPSISIRGDARNKGRNITIQGSGEYLSRTFGRQNVTIVGANQAELMGVTVSNPNPRGYGLWIESSNPVVAENTFFSSTQDGISIVGNSAPSIRKNYFYRNGANGMTIVGKSRPEVRENVFQETGFGINIAQNAAPIIVSNQILNNRTGVVVQANAQPILRNNLIQDNKEDGLVAIAQGKPDIGNTTEPGGNQFRNNARYDINASAAKQVIPAYGNTLSNNRIIGNVDTTSTTASIAQNPQPAAVHNGSEITFSAPGVEDDTRNISQRTSPTSQPSLSSRKTTDFPTPSNQTARTEQPPTPPAPQSSVPRSQPINQRQSLPQLAPAPVGESALIPTPNTKIPINNTSNTRKPPKRQSSPTVPRQSQSLATTTTPEKGLRYRVMVEVANNSQQQLVKSLAPAAFRTVRQGRGVMQAGVFSTRHNAEQLQKLFKDKGLRSMVESMK